MTSECISVSPETVPLSDNSPLRPNLAATYRKLRLHFPNLIPSKPYCTDYLSCGLQIRPKHAALQKRYIQLNSPSSFRWMMHDIDLPDAYFAHEDANLPPPNVIMINPDTGHAHAAYLLANPVARHSLSRLAPLHFFAAVERGVGRRLGADFGYTGLIAKNPMHAHWKVEWRRDDPYTLYEIESHLFERDMRPAPMPQSTFGAGRNVTIFDELRSIAYREVRNFQCNGAAFEEWLNFCIKRALALNTQFPQALKLSEVRAIAKSVAKWTWRRFSLQKFVARQTFLSKLGHAKRWGNGSAEKLQPWNPMGISRATYYRRKRNARGGSHF